MFLKSVALRNFRCFSDTSLDFVNQHATKDGELHQVTILLGKNGTGKSNLLQALALITAGRNALGELLGSPNDWIRLGEKSCEVSAIVIDGTGEERELTLTIERGKTPAKVIAQNAKSLAALDDALEQAGHNYLTLGYGTSRRLNVDRGHTTGSSNFKHLRAQNVATLFDPDATLTALDTWAIALDKKRDKHGLEVVRRALSEFLPSVKFERIDRKAGQLIFKTPDGEMPMQSLSGGQQNVAAWVGDLLHHVTESFGSFEAPLKAHGLLLIDEIDLHLHPAWQRELLTYLRKKLPNFQFVATTQSPLTAQQAHPGELAVLRRQGKRITASRFDPDPRELYVHQLLMSELFDVTSDESAEREQTKLRYQKLKAQAPRSRSLKQTRELTSLTAQLQQQTSSPRTNLNVEAEHLDLLKQIQKELRDK